MLKALLVKGMKWEKKDGPYYGSHKWVSECGDYEIFCTKDDKFRLIAFEHEPTAQFPQCEFWMREYDTLLEAAQQAEMM